MDGKQTPTEEPTWQFKPGETISPRQEVVSKSEAADSSPPTAPQPTAETPPAPALKPIAPPDSEPASSTDTPAQELSRRQFTDTYDQADTDGLRWTASEFIAHEKTAGWHMGLLAVAVVAAVALWFITKDIVTAVVVVMAGGVLSLYGGRRPGELQYQLDNDGLSIGTRHFSFDEFRAFAVVPEGAFASIALLPTKRFAPMTTLYFAPEDGDVIVEILGNHLPQQPMKADLIDGLMRKIRF